MNGFTKFIKIRLIYFSLGVLASIIVISIIRLYNTNLVINPSDSFTHQVNIKSAISYAIDSQWNTSISSSGPNDSKSVMQNEKFEGFRSSKNCILFHDSVDFVKMHPNPYQKPEPNFILDRDYEISDIGFLKKGTIVKLDDVMIEGGTTYVLYLNIKYDRFMSVVDTMEKFAKVPYYLFYKDSVSGELR